MVNQTLNAREAERALALGYAPADSRGALDALWALDGALAAILRTTRQPMVGQMRLMWWREALSALDRVVPPANPVLQALAAHVVPLVTGAGLAAMVDGWEALLDEPLSAGAMRRFAEARGGGLFAAAGAVLGVERSGLREAGAGWALGDLAGNLGDPELAAMARASAVPLLAGAMRTRWPVGARSLGGLVLLAREGAPGSPGRVARLAWHRATGL